MLNELDQELEDSELKFVGYADDIIIMCKSKRAALRVKESITRFIEDKLKLKVNRDKTTVAYLGSIKYLGYGFYKTKRGFRFRPHGKSKKKLKTRLSEIFKQAKGMSYEWLSSKLTQVLRGWLNYFYLADMKGFLIDLQQWINHRIRCHHWRRWKKVKTRFRNLTKLGVDSANAIQMANTRKGPWRSSVNPIIHIALNNKKLQDRGYPEAYIQYSNIYEKKLADFNSRRLAYYGYN